MNEWLNIIILGIVEGLTEFLPISSTGHLIIAGSWLNINDPRFDALNIIIQLGAILAVVWHYRKQLINILINWRQNPIIRNLIIAFLPVLILGPLLHKKIKILLFNPPVVAVALFVGGILIFVAEYFMKKRQQNNYIEVDNLEQMSWQKALAIGLFQIFSMIPGTSRSAATIIGGLFSGLSRKAATEFSFYLALPTLGGAFVYELYKSHNIFTSSRDWEILIVGLVVSFITALIAIRWLLGFVQKHSFNVFAWYRIILAIIVLIVFYNF